MIDKHALMDNQSSYTDEKAFLMEYEGAALLESFGLPMLKSAFAHSKEEAVIIAKSVGYPLVAKGMSREITHKTEAGVVKLNIQNENELLLAYEEIMENASLYNKDAKVEGVFVQAFAPKGIELIIGIKKDSIFGHQLIIGLGGIYVEVMRDFAMRKMPITMNDVEEMVRELQSYPLLRGYRNHSGINMEKLVSICLSLNDFVNSHPEVEELDLNPVIFSENNAYICDVRLLLGEKDFKMPPVRPLHYIDKMLNPSSIAVVGASTNEKKNGGRLLRYIIENGFKGNIYPINPKADSIKGYKAFANLIDVPDDIDLACIIVDARHVSQVIKQCVQKKVKAAIIYSSGFAEIGPKGRMIQQEVLQQTKAGNLLVLGPNSIGVASPNINTYTAFGAALEFKKKIPGNIGFISQSGAMGSALLSRAWEQGAGFSRWISVGNEADLSISDFIEVLAKDEITKVISVFMEDIKHPRKFEIAATTALNQKKPLLIYKTGRSTIGKKAVQSHTGSIAGDDEVYSTAFKKYGAIRIERFEELIDVSRAFTIQPLPKGKRVGVVTASGGACSVIADLCEDKGIEIPELSISSNKIKQYIPSFGSARNPIDVTAEVISKPEMFQKVVEELIGDTAIDAVIVMLTTNADPGAAVIARSLIDVFQDHDKPIIIGRLGADAIAPNAMEIYSQENMPVYSTPERVVSVMNYLIKYSEMLNKRKEIQ
ncbi:acetate--CoA ligase family protein [Cytobacillus kochii]|uniref:acetate--CoA ligase family protein n=1 Tax=Cytobacillus kochii TaxID=859143 RepID=UPI00278A06A9|nr:acetate--CoA ligase family protein [Cytobacillus kochii]MDQ0185339.1 acyl-CoA synthetase (NDP forming) [Cytobacillus kochii]